MSLGPNFADQFRQAAGYVDRILGATALPAVPRVAWAQTYPSRPITMIVPFAAGGPTSPGSRAHVPTPGKRTLGHP
jgi:tripartite-type tricarboxylate transporter receptor subunit TctC